MLLFEVFLFFRKIFVLVCSVSVFPEVLPFVAGCFFPGVFVFFSGSVTVSGVSVCSVSGCCCCCFVVVVFRKCFSPLLAVLLFVEFIFFRIFFFFFFFPESETVMR